MNPGGVPFSVSGTDLPGGKKGTVYFFPAWLTFLLLHREARSTAALDSEGRVDGVPERILQSRFVRHQGRHMRHTLAGSTTTALLLALLVTTTTVSLEAQDWPSFRGADALPIADDDPRLPLTWGPTENVVWKTPVDGLGY